MSRLRVNEVIIVEGKYDATAISSLVDGLVLTTDGFSIYNDAEKKELIRRLGRQRGLVILTDSDAAGFQIRRYVEQLAKGCAVKNAYIPAVQGKESRKPAASREGTLGVEGLPPEVLRAALENAGVVAGPPRQQGRQISYTDLYELGLSGGGGSAEKRRVLLTRLGLPPRLSKKALVGVLNSLYSYDEFAALASGEEKPVLFWDFHGTLSLPDITWFDAAMYALQKGAPGCGVGRKAVEKEFGGTCLPWLELPERDTRHLVGSKKWWAWCEANFTAMLRRSGLEEADAAKCAPLIREYILNPASYALYPDAISTLRELQRRGYRSYILSNNFPELERVTTGLGLAPYLAGVIVSGCVGYEKPRPEIFNKALQIAENPKEAWMVGDNPVDDIQGASNLGFTTVAVHGIKASGVTHSVQNLSAILSLLP